MKKLYVIFTLIVVGGASFSQTQEQNVRLFLSESGGSFYTSQQLQGVSPSKLEDIPGKIYLNEGFQPGVVLSSDNQKGRIDGRYNVMNDEMQVRTEKEEILALQMHKIKAVAIGAQIFIPVAYEDEKKQQGTGYFELLTEGPQLSLLKRYHSMRHKTEYHPAVATENDYEYIIESNLYYFRNGEKAYPLGRKISQILPLFDPLSPEMEIYARQNNLKPKKDEDMVRLFEEFTRAMKEHSQSN